MQGKDTSQGTIQTDTMKPQEFVATHIEQEQMPFVNALEAYKEEHLIPFHTPGHKIGQGAPGQLKKWMEDALPYDLGVMYALDDLHEPETCLKDAQDLAAQLYGAEHTWFSINGTTAIIEAMLLGTLREGDTIIVPREAHRSVTGGLVLSGANPVYVEGRFDSIWGIQLGITVQDLEASIAAHPEAKAVLFVHPNYYGVGLPIVELVAVAHAHGLIVLVDEAHGAHLRCMEAAERGRYRQSNEVVDGSEQLGIPISAVDAGADLVAQSTHKLVGSLTQTSMLHGQGNRIDWRRVTQSHQVLQSTSPNYIFLASLDMARHQLATEGVALLAETLRLARKVRHELKKVQRISVMDRSDLPANMSFDETKILINFTGCGMTGKEAELLLRTHKIEVELIIGNSVLVLITLGDTEASINALIRAVMAVSELADAPHADIYSAQADVPSEQERNDIALVDRDRHHQTTAAQGTKLPQPHVAVTPRQAFMSKSERIPIENAIGRISCETIAYYPPGIPFIAMGEQYTEDILEYIKSRQKEGYLPNGASDSTLATVKVIQ